MRRIPMVRFGLLALVAAAIALPQPASAATPSGDKRPADYTLTATRSHGPGQPGKPAALPVRHGQFHQAGAAAPSASRSPAQPAALAPIGQAAGASGLSANGATPSDSTGAIGPIHYIEMVNNQVGLYDRTLSKISSVGLGTFDGVTAGAEVGDVQVEWDNQDQRWLYASLELYGCSATCSDNKIAFGWSKGGDASGITLANTDWCNFHLDTGTNLFDYPKLGHDTSFIDIGANVFDSGGNFTTSSVVAIPMPGAGDTSCTAPTATGFGTKLNPIRHGNGDAAFTPVPANVADASSTAYITAADFNGDAIGVWHIAPGAPPTLVHDGEVAITAWAPPTTADFAVPQPGGAQTIDALDGRLTNAVQTADPSIGGSPEAVWTQHTVQGAGGRTVVTWFELLPATQTLHQEGTLASPNLYLFNAAISPTSRGDGAVIHYNTGSASTLVDARAQSRNAADALNTMSGELVLAQSKVTDTDGSCTGFGGPPCRWGDYSGASPDPSDCKSVWGTTMLNAGAQSTGAPTWTTQNFALSESALHTAVSTRQYRLNASDGVTWNEVDATNLAVGVAPCADSDAVISANADLFTSQTGVNQDIGLFVDDNGTAGTTPLAWKESGGSNGTFSPNAAYVQAIMPMTAGHHYVVRLKWKSNLPTSGSIFAGAGPLSPGNYSPTRVSVQLFPHAAAVTNSAVMTTQQQLSGSDGVTWQQIPGTTPMTISPGANDEQAVLGANADLWTDTAGYNQDLGIQIAGGTFGAGTLVAWKESGGFAGTFSPNAAHVQADPTLLHGQTYTVTLVWKTNKAAPNTASIFVGAGSPVPGFSPTSLIAYALPAGPNPQVALITTQPHLSNSNGSSWSAVGVQTGAIAPALSTWALLGANADLFTNKPGFNQDIAIFVSVDGGAAQLVAWKESGGFGGTFSPNAAFVQAAYPMVGGHSYVFSLRWKTNKPASGDTIYAGAGPISAAFSPTSLSVQTIA